MGKFYSRCHWKMFIQRLNWLRGVWFLGGRTKMQVVCPSFKKSRPSLPISSEWGQNYGREYMHIATLRAYIRREERDFFTSDLPTSFSKNSKTGIEGRDFWNRGQRLLVYKESFSLTRLNRQRRAWFLIWRNVAAKCHSTCHKNHAPLCRFANFCKTMAYDWHRFTSFSCRYLRNRLKMSNVTGNIFRPGRF